MIAITRGKNGQSNDIKINKSIYKPQEQNLKHNDAPV